MSFLPNFAYQYLLSTIYKIENSLQSHKKPSATTGLTASFNENVKKIEIVLKQHINLFTDRSSLLTLFTKVIHLESSLGNSRLKQTLQRVHRLFETKIGRLATSKDAPLGKSLKLTAAIEELQEIAFRDPDHPLFINNIQEWFEANQASFDQETLRALPINQQLQLIALLASLKEHLPSHIHFVSRLPNQMESYFRGVSTDDQESALQEINRLFTTPEHQRIALAHFINCRQISLNTAVSALSLTKEDLLSLAPYLKYVDLRNCNVLEGSNDTINFLNDCSSLTHLFINNPAISYLPVLPLCTTLNCSRCSALTALPPLPLCTTLNCSYCYALRELPALPLCSTLNCSECRTLTALPDLPLCTTLDCSRCSALRELPPLPLCTTLNCSCCYTLTALPPLPLYTTLNCSWCKALTALHPLPHCTTLDCSWCEALSVLPDLPLCTTLKCSECSALTALPALPLCTTLDCEDCRNLTAIPALPVCTTLDCSSCFNLTALPPLPLCTTLDCSWCYDLTELPALPLCTTLKCSYCHTLTALPPLPLYTTLECSRCSALRELPPLPLCSTLDCSGCEALSILPPLPLCTTLDCSECRTLTALPPLPLCSTLDCSWCSALRELPALPLCTTLKCEHCPSLQDLPELPQNITLYTGNTNSRLEFTQLKVKIDELQTNPKKYLLQLGKEFLLQRHPFPNIYYYNPNGSPCEAIDIGGVRRDFISSLFERLFIGNQLSIECGPPIYPKLDGTAETKNCYTIIGVFFTLCYPRDSFFKIGEIFDENFFTLMKLLADPEIPEESLIQSILLLRIPNKAIRDEIYASLQNPSLSLSNEAKSYAETFAGLDTTASLRENLIRDVKQDKCLPAIQVIASAMKSHLAPPIWNEFIQESAADSQDRIQGRLSKDLLLRRLNWKKTQNVSDASYTQTQGFLTDWITKASHEDLKCFVRVVTGNNTLGPDPVKIKIYNAQNQIPVAHTCSLTLELPSEYPNQQTFDKKLGILLTEGIQGFQIA